MKYKLIIDKEKEEEINNSENIEVIHNEVTNNDNSLEKLVEVAEADMIETSQESVNDEN